MGGDPVSLRGGPISIGVCVHVSHRYFRSVYIFKSGTGTWGLGDARTWDTSTRGDSRMWDVGAGGPDKQTSPDFCAEFVKYNFWQSSER